MSDSESQFEQDGFALMSSETLHDDESASARASGGARAGSNGVSSAKKPAKERKIKGSADRAKIKTKAKLKLKLKLKRKEKDQVKDKEKAGGTKRKSKATAHLASAGLDKEITRALGKHRETKKDRVKEPRKKVVSKSGKASAKAAVVSTDVPRASGMLSMFELCTSSADGDHDRADGPHLFGPHGDDDGSDMDEVSSMVDSDGGSIKTPPKKRMKTGTEDEGWSDHNRWYCNICKDGGQLLCCDRCPRAFHMSCLGMDEQAVPDSEWFCKMCRECLDRRRLKKESREKARLVRETEKLEREAEKRRLKQMKEDIIAQKSVEAIEHKAKRVLENKDRIISHKKMKYKDKEEEKLGKLAEDLGETVRLAKERLDKLEKEDVALKKKEEAFNKKRRPADGTHQQDDEARPTLPPAPLVCSFSDMPPHHIGQMLAIWDSLVSFADVLKISQIPVEQFAAALLHKEHSAIVTEVHMCLLDLILEDREDEDYVSDDEASMDETERFRYEVQHAPLTVGVPTSNLLNSSSWPCVLFNLIESVPRFKANCSDTLKEALASLHETDYPLLDIGHKLALLDFLVYRVSMTEAAREMLGNHVSEGLDVTKEYNRAVLHDRKIVMEEEKKLREKHRTELADLIEKGKGGLKTWLKGDKKGSSANHVQSDVVSVEGDDERKTVDSVSTASTASVGSVSDSELDDLTDEALSKNEEDLEQLLSDELISRHEYLARKKLLDSQREKLRRRAEEQQKKLRAQEQLERKRAAAKKGIQEGLVSRDPNVLKAAIEKGVECDLPDRIIVSARHVLEILDAEEVREEEAAERKRKFNETMRQFYIRTEPLGRDHRGFKYWAFRGDSEHLYVHKPREFSFAQWFQASTHQDLDAVANTPTDPWSVYSSRGEIRALIQSLDEDHPREHHLKMALEENFDRIVADMPEAKPGLMMADMVTEQDVAAGRKRARHAPGSPDGVADFNSWRNDKKQWRKKNHLEFGVDAFRQDLIEVELWLSKRLKELGSTWHESRGEWVKTVKAITEVEECVQPLLALEDEVMSFQLKAQKLLSGHSNSSENGKGHATSEPNGNRTEDANRSDEEDEEDEEEMEDVNPDDSSILWPTKKCRDRWVTEVNKARTLATLSTALACFVQRLEILGLSESSPLDDSSVITRRGKTIREKQTRKDLAAKKKQKKEEEAEVASFFERTSADDWEEDCYICSEGGEVLCCDGCPRVFHFSCVGLRRVPRGKTFCHYCDSSVKPVFPVVKRSRAPEPAESENASDSDASEGEEDSSSEEEEVVVDTANLNAATKHAEDQWDQECNICHLGGELLCCDGCPHAFHSTCIGLKTIPEDEWFCKECNRQTCGKCKKNKIRLDSHVICGSEDGTQGCDRVFHLKCANLTTVPEDDWYCPKCRKTLQK